MDLNHMLDMTDEELKDYSFVADEQTIEVLRMGLMETVESGKAAYDSLDENSVNFLTAKHVKALYDQAQSANLFLQLIASGNDIPIEGPSGG